MWGGRPPARSTRAAAGLMCAVSLGSTAYAVAALLLPATADDFDATERARARAAIR